MSTTTKVIYRQGNWRMYRANEVAVVLEEYSSDEYSTGYTTGWILSWRVGGSEMRNGHYVTIKQGRELIVPPDLTFEFSQAIRLAIKKYDELQAEYAPLLMRS